MPLKLKRLFEKEYAKKGYSKGHADRIFYGHEANMKKKRHKSCLVSSMKCHMKGRLAGT